MDDFDSFTDDQPPYLWQIVLWVIVAIAAVVFVADWILPSARAEENPQADDEEIQKVKIGVSCGTLIGKGQIVIIDPVLRKIFRIPFECKTSET